MELGTEVFSTTRSFAAMGTSCNITLYMEADVWSENATVKLLDLAENRVRILENCWSRFRPESDLSMVNTLSGNGPIEVSDDFFILVDKMMQAHQATQGLFDPTVHKALISHGYIGDIASLPWTLDSPFPHPVPGMEGIEIDRTARTVSLPTGVTLDPGGIGKGLAADIICEELPSAADGVTGLLVDIGGDIVFRGETGRGHWTISISHQGFDTNEPGLVLPTTNASCAIATSGSKTRQWGPELFHLIDPKTGMPAGIAASQVTIIAEHGWEAEAHAKAALLRDHNALLHMRENNLEGMVRWADGRTESTPLLTKILDLEETQWKV